MSSIYKFISSVQKLCDTFHMTNNNMTNRFSECTQLITIEKSTTNTKYLIPNEFDYSSRRTALLSYALYRINVHSLK